MTLNTCRLKIGIDLDGTIFNTIKTICDIYINRHWEEIRECKIQFPLWYRVKTWNMNDEMPSMSLSELSELFQCDEFFRNLQIYHEPNGVNLVDFLNELAFEHDIYLVTCGSSRNLELKKEWASNNLPNCTFVGLIHSEDERMDKSQFECDIFLDDNQDALYSVKAKYKLLANFHTEKETEWNSMAVKDRLIYNCESTTEAINTICDIIDFEKMCAVS